MPFFLSPSCFIILSYLTFLFFFPSIKTNIIVPNINIVFFCVTFTFVHYSIKHFFPFHHALPIWIDPSFSNVILLLLLLKSFLLNFLHNILHYHYLQYNFNRLFFLPLSCFFFHFLSWYFSFKHPHLWFCCLSLPSTRASSILHLPSYSVFFHFSVNSIK